MSLADASLCDFFIDQPRGDTYAQLITASVHVCTELQLVIDRSRRPDAISLCAAWRSNLLAEQITTSWPGTVSDRPQRVLRYRFDAPVADRILERTSSFSDWFREGCGDPALGDGQRWWLTTVLHENIYFLTVTNREWEDLRRSVSKLHLQFVRKGSSV